MSNRKRNIPKQFYINSDEEKLIKEKMEKIGTRCFGDYARKMLIDGYIIKKDYAAIKELSKEINKIGVNINQIAKKTNETNRIYDADIKELKMELNEIWQLLKSNLSNQL